MSEDDICPVCGILRDEEELTPEAYEVIWDSLPHLRAAQESGEVVRCEERGRRLTLGET
jgi:acetone carboxylase gamma subunit